MRKKKPREKKKKRDDEVVMAEEGNPVESSTNTTAQGIHTNDSIYSWPFHGSIPL